MKNGFFEPARNEKGEILCQYCGDPEQQYCCPEPSADEYYYRNLEIRSQHADEDAQRYTESRRWS